jgi:integrase
MPQKTFTEEEIKELKKRAQEKPLSDRTLKSLCPAANGKPYDIKDIGSRGLHVRVMPSGQRTFVLVARYPGHSQPARRALGVYDDMSLEEAHDKAAQWRKDIKKKIDPTRAEQQKQVEKEREQKNTFRAVLAAYNKDKLKSLRRGREVNRDLEKLADDTGWGGRPITEITALEVRDVIKQYKDRGKLHHAHNLLGYVRRLYDWAIDQEVYAGLQTSPCDHLKPKKLIGKKTQRTRVLSDVELRAAWIGAKRLGYPYGPLFQLLMLTGQRKSEVAEMRWSEIGDLAKKLWSLPPERVKANAAHLVPLSDDAVAVLTSLPRFDGDYVFSIQSGARPVAAFSEYKRRYDAEILKALKEHDPKAKLAHFVIHDLRRTVRTHLSAIPNISDLVRELVIGHTKPELHKVYDQYAYLDEKRFALDAWAGRLRSIVEPPPANVVALGKARA